MERREKQKGQRGTQGMAQHVVVVDDEELVTLVFEDFLSEAGYRVSTFTHPAMALEYLQHSSADVLIADYAMPQMDGITLFLKAKEVQPHLVGIIVTAFATMQVAVEAVNQGIGWFLTKPVLREHVLEAVEQVLKRKALEQENARLQALMMLYQSSRRLLLARDRQEVYSLTIQLAQEATRAEAASLFVLEEGRLVPVAAQGLPCPLEALPSMDLRAQSITALVAREKRPLLLAPESPDLEAVRSLLRRPEISASLCVPLSFNHLIHGVLNLSLFDPSRTFQRSDAELVGILANQAALVLERLRLLEQQMEQERLVILGRTASTIIHDLKNPMTVIRGAAEMLQDLAPQAAEFASMIVEQTDHLVEMLQEILNFARGEQKLAPQWIAAGAFLKEVASSQGPILQRENILLRTEVEWDGQAWVDPVRLRRAILNLISNSRDAMPQGGTITLRSRREESHWVVEVEDTGKGIPPRVLERLFEPFFTHGKEHGTGLGTTIVRSIVEAHGGSVSVHSEEGKGTCFRLLLPLPSHTLAERG